MSATDYGSIISQSVSYIVLICFAYADCACCRAKGKPPVGGVSIFGGVTDELLGGASTEPEESTITSTPPAPSKPAVTSTVSAYITVFPVCSG